MEYCSSQAWPETLRSSVGKAQEVLTDEASELQILLRKPPGEQGSVEDLAKKVLQTITNALSILSSGDRKVCDMQVGSPSSVDQIKSEDPAGEKRKNPASKDRRGGYKRRKTSQTWTKLTATPVDDGFAWRKYGQKEILNAKHPRNYFRCTHKHDQGCQATKQVQRTEDDPPMFRTIYMGRHTCRDTLRAPQLVLDADTYLEDSSCLLNFQSNDPSPTTRKQGYGAYFSSLIISSDPMKTESNLTAHNQSGSSEYVPVPSPDLTSFESSGPSTMLAGTTSGSEYGDVISSVYSSCNTASSDEQSLNVDDLFDGHDFVDFQFDEELH